MRAFLIALTLAACASEPSVETIDGESAETFAASLERVRAPLGVADRAKFEAGLKLVEGRVFYGTDSRAEFEANLRDTLDGVTAAQVIEEAEKTGDYAARRAVEGVDAAARELPQAIDEINEARRDSVNGKVK